ncbi:LHFPL tetraspan subfamily member 7 protein isoform X2 [Nerophis ophidion]|uniref:LHFPL tetraspan subfamily member 7 protein isoform X2 n=1 Tax=Nerophis ophidion TaxID=159077 RepID=UPI002ADF386F|nr:LHFPL tetraspan subfamily member 7 protein isoform X2 [Nerophis ophidion]
MNWLLGRQKKNEEEVVSSCPCMGLSPHATMLSCVGCFWVLLSSVLVAVCSFSFISPAWIVKEQLRNNNNHHHPPLHHHSNKDSVSLGLLWHCSESVDHMYRCYTFGGLGKFAEIPSSSWQTSAVLCSGGCALLAVSSLLAIITIFLPGGGCERRICTLAGYMQMAAESLSMMLSSLLQADCGFLERFPTSSKMSIHQSNAQSNQQMPCNHGSK